MALELIAFAAVPAGLAVATSASGGTPNTAPQPTSIGPQGGVRVGAGGAPGATIPDLLSMYGTVQVGLPQSPSTNPPTKNSRGMFSVIATVQQELPKYSQTDAEIDKKIADIEAYGAKAYNSLSDKAKKAGATYLNEKYHLDPPLKGTESWEEIGKRIAGPVGSEAGQAAGEFFGGPAGAVVGEKVGAYLGVKLDELLNRAAPEIRDWFAARYQDVSDWVSDTAHEVADKVQDWIGAIF